MISIARGNKVNTKPAHEVVRARCEHVISRAGDGVREGCDHRDEQEEKRSEGGTGGGRRPAPTVLSRIRQGVLSAPLNHMGLRTAKRKIRPRSESACDRRRRSPPVRRPMRRPSGGWLQT